MNRSQMRQRLGDPQTEWDVIVIGGGATGLGTALDAATRGYKTLLLEQGDFAHATSSRSTKLIHGGIRYLRQGRFGLVRQSLKERTRLLQNAPHIVHAIPFVLTASNPFVLVLYWAGLKLYDLLAGTGAAGASRLLSKADLEALFPTLDLSIVCGGICYTDGQFDDARLAISLAMTLVEQGGTALNYMPVIALIKERQRVAGVVARDSETGLEYRLKARVVINATGAYVDAIKAMEEPSQTPSIIPSQGSHILLDRSFMPGDHAFILPETSDGRILFIIPWNERVLVGTTDIALERVPKDPQPTEAEIDYLLSNVGRYTRKKPTRDDILAVFAGIRPLVKPTTWMESSRISRDHVVTASSGHLVTVTGGKWTTYRQMAEETVDRAADVAALPRRASVTKTLRLHGWEKPSTTRDEWSYLGSDRARVEALAEGRPELLERLHPDLSCRGVDVVWAVRHEMARTVEDVLARRTRCLYQNTEACSQIAPAVATLMREVVKTESLY